MNKRLFTFLFLWMPLLLSAQEKSFNEFLADSVMEHASVSFCIIDAESGKSIFANCEEKCLIPGSILKLVSSAAALEILGPDHKFQTSLGYTGNLMKHSGILKGDIIITGGGDPSFGSTRFDKYYKGFTDKWIDEIKKTGIKRIKGRVITDDSYFDYQPVPAKWLWEDLGNYYGAGAYGLSVFDNTYEIHFRTSPDSLKQIITTITTPECSFDSTNLTNLLGSAGTKDNGYVFAAPYSTKGWIAGSIPFSNEDYVLKASITDPPYFLAKLIDQKLRSSGVMISGRPTTTRLIHSGISETETTIDRIDSPPLRDIIAALNHESINLYAEHLTRELGKVIGKVGSTEKGIEVIRDFLSLSGINTGGIYLEDGSGLSPMDAVNARTITDVLFFMKKKGKYFNDYYSSLPEPGSAGTLKNHFSDPSFNASTRIKSGSMTRVRSYAGYLKTVSGKYLIFCIIVNNFSGPSSAIISKIEEILKETIQNN